MGVNAQEEAKLNQKVKLEQQVKLQSEAIKELQKFNVSGYIQTQFQYGERDASLMVGSENENKEKPFNRFGIRRGRIKFTYQEGIASGVFQLDITERGVGFKDAYLNLKDPWLKTSALRIGVFDRPFGYEIGYSSSQRETPERSTIFQTLFPEERDLGGIVILQTSKTSPLNFLKLEAGLFAGNGIKQETDNRKDFIGHLSSNKDISHDLNLGFGLSYYNGRVYQGTENVYTLQDNAFVLNSDATNKGQFAKREYFGLDGQFNIKTLAGKTQLRGEYLCGIQPGSKSDSESPNSSTLPNTDTYIRKFSGGYVILIQDIGTSPFSAVVKYDYYDPNSKVSTSDIGLNETSIGDIASNTLGLGLLWRVVDNVRLQAYYELVNNEESENLEGYREDLKDNVFTLRMQYKF